MEDKTRVLAYKQAQALSNEELLAASGGLAKLTCRVSHKGTNGMPGMPDLIYDSEYD